METRLLLSAITFAPVPRRLVPAVTLAGRHIPGEIEPDHAGERSEVPLQRLKIEFAVRIMRDHCVRHALLANQSGERARIDAGDGDDATRFEPGVEILRGTIIRRCGDLRTKHAAAHAR